MARALALVERVLLWLFARLFERDALREKLRRVKSYADFRRIGEQIDERDNAQYRLDESDCEGICDAPLLRQRAEKLEALVKNGLNDPAAVALALRTELRRNLGAIGNVRLYAKLHVGTKNFVKRYLSAVTRAVTFVAQTDFGSKFSLAEKELALRNTRQAYGGSALLFSGGASLGMYHFGVVRLLHEEGLLPKVLSGSSIGSLVAALVAVRTDSELTKLLTDIQNLAVDFGQPFDPDGSGARKLRRFLESGVVMDICKLATVIRTHTGDVTFLEAYQKTGRIVNITVSSTRTHEMPLLLNYLTAPDVLLWSASAASCALPLLYEPVELLAKDRSGKIVKYFPSGLRFSDGSVGSDLPMRRLAELFNVNQFIVSQVNPHMLLLLDSCNQASFWSKAKYLVRSELRHRVLQLARLGLLPRFLGFMTSAFAQPFEGDITIIPRVRFSDLSLLLSNPTPHILRRLANHGYRSAFHVCEMIRDRTAIERALEAAILEVNSKLLAEENEAGCSGSHRARLAHSTAFLSVTDTFAS